MAKAVLYVLGDPRSSVKNMIRVIGILIMKGNNLTEKQSIPQAYAGVMI